MRGFIIRRSSGAGRQSFRESNIVVPLENTQKISFASNIYIMAWGNAPGDVIFSSGRESGLLFNGYITEMPIPGTFATQLEAVDLLREFIDLHSGDNNALTSMLNGLNGCFSFVRIDRNTSDILAITDRKMSRPLWCCSRKGDVAVGSNPLAVASLMDAFEPDPGGIGSLMLYGGQIAPTHTTFRDVRAVDSAELKWFYHGGTTASLYWHTFSHQPDYRKSRRAWVEYITERLFAAAERINRISPRQLVFLSGGLDSRLACAALCAVGAEPLTATMTDSENIELSVARKVASKLGCRHETIIRNRYWYLDSMHTIVRDTGGANDWIHSHFARAYTMLREKEGEGNIDAALLGNGLESFNKLIHRVDPDDRHIWSADEFRVNFDKLYPAAYVPANRESTLSVFTPAARRAVEEQLGGNIVTRYLAIRDVSEEPATVMSYFVRWQAISSLTAFFNNVDVRLAGPERSLMLDAEMLDILSVLPARMRDRAGLEAAVISRISPAAARIVYSNTLLPPSFPEAAHSFSRYIRPKIGAVRRYMHPSFRSSGSWSNLFYLFGSDARWNKTFSDVFHDRELFPPDIFDYRVIRDKWDRLQRGEYQYGVDIERLFLIGRVNQIRRTAVMPGMEEMHSPA